MLCLSEQTLQSDWNGLHKLTSRGKNLQLLDKHAIFTVSVRNYNNFTRNLEFFTANEIIPEIIMKFTTLY